MRRARRHVMVPNDGRVVLDNQRRLDRRGYELVGAPRVVARHETDHPATPIEHRALDSVAMVRIAAGDAIALGGLYDRYGHTIFGIVLRMVGSPEHAEEVTQDVFHSVWLHAASYRASRGSVRTWLFAISRNAATASRQTRGRPFERETRFVDTPALVADGRVDDEVIGVRGGMGLPSAGTTLPPQQQVALGLAFWSGVRQGEIAERTGASLDTVKSRVRLGMANLRKQARA